MSQVVTLTGSDALSGVAATYYTIDGGARQTYTAPFTVSAQGSHTIVYWSVDAVANTETPRPATSTSTSPRRRSATTPTAPGTTPP